MHEDPTETGVETWLAWLVGDVPSPFIFKVRVTSETGLVAQRVKVTSIPLTEVATRKIN